MKDAVFKHLAEEEVPDDEVCLCCSVLVELLSTVCADLFLSSYCQHHDVNTMYPRIAFYQTSDATCHIRSYQKYPKESRNGLNNLS